MMQYQRAGEGNSSIQGKHDAIDESSEIIFHEGKKYKKVQIENTDEEFLMDEDQNIYDMKMQLIGKAGDDDDD
jgi:hypothetical protein